MDASPFSLTFRINEHGEIYDVGVGALELVGEKVSGHALHQISGELILADKRTFPFFISADGTWVRTDEIEPIRPFAQIAMGAGFRSDGLIWPEFTHPLKPDQFVQTFGGSTISITIDGDEQKWRFSVDDLPRSADRQERERRVAMQKAQRPVIRRKQTAQPAR